MKLPKQLMEAINETCDALEMAASGAMNPSLLTMRGTWNGDGVDYDVRLHNTGKDYLGEWDIEVTVAVVPPPLPPDDKNVPRKRAPRKRTVS